MLYLAMCLAGLAVGFWPDALWRWSEEFPNQPLPALQCLFVAQVGFVLLAYPLVLLRRGRKSPRAPYLRQVVPETLGFFALVVPLYVAAGFVSDVTLVDGARAAMFVACLFPLAWASGYCMRGKPRAAGPVVVFMLVAAIGLPAGYYIGREFLDIAPRGAAAEILWRVAPATFAWETSSPRQGDWLPRPLWAMAVWPVAAIAIHALGMTAHRGRTDG